LWGIWVLGACLALLPARAQAQAQTSTGPQYAPADPQVPIPYGSTRPEDGGLYTFGQFGMYRQTNPLRNQLVAVRGLFAYDTGGRTVTRNVEVFIPSRNGTTIPTTPAAPGDTFFLMTNDLPDFAHDTGPPPANTNFGITITGGLEVAFSVSPGIGTTQTTLGLFVFRPETQVLAGLFNQPGFVGSADPALDVQQLHQRNSYQPSLQFGLGWKFRDGSSVNVSWLYITEAQYRAGATLAPPGLRAGANADQVLGPQLENTFLFSPVFNFPPEYAGADFKVQVQPGTQSATPNQDINVNSQTAFGIWNAASIMTLEFRQRFQQWDIDYRMPIWETENYRFNGVMGARFSWIWEKFKWVTTSLGVDTKGTADTQDDTIISGPQFVGIYSNVTSNRMYGPFIACENEWYLGHGFAIQVRTLAAGLLDTIKERAKYETAAKYLGLPENKYARGEWNFVPQLQAKAGLMWYPTEFVQLYAGYDFMVFFNTKASPRPIDFDYSNVNPGWKDVNRIFDGWNAGICFTW
jgi:hypothetical protein